MRMSLHLEKCVPRFRVVIREQLLQLIFRLQSIPFLIHWIDFIEYGRQVHLTLFLSSVDPSISIDNSWNEKSVSGFSFIYAFMSRMFLHTEFFNGISLQMNNLVIYNPKGISILLQYENTKLFLFYSKLVYEY